MILSEENKKGTELVSIIVPIYNAENFIEQGYKQIYQQDYPRIEIVFIDNNSTDNSVELISNLMKIDQRIVLLFEKKQGAGAARNKGIQESNGEILSFFDIDDTIIQDKISRHVDILNKNRQIAMVFGKLRKLYSDDRFYFLPPTIIEAGINLPNKVGVIWLNNFGALVNPSVVSCRRQEAIEIGGFEEQLLRGEDAAFMIKMALHYPVYYDDMLTGSYIRHQDSTISKDNQKMDGNPYYFQYSRFYLPYVYELALDSNNFYLNQQVDFIVMTNLNVHMHRVSNQASNRFNILKTELKYLHKQNFPISKIIILFCVVWLPMKFSKTLLKLYYYLIQLKHSRK